MPRCMMNSVRGYRDGKYWGCEGDSQNVMRTRSGLVISTIPKLRASRTPPGAAAAGPTGAPQGGPTTSSSSSSLPPNPSSRGRKTRAGPRRLKSMSCLPFVTRFALIRDGVPLDFTDDDVFSADDWTDDECEEADDAMSIGSSCSLNTEGGDMEICDRRLHEDLLPNGRETEREETGESASDEETAHQAKKADAPSSNAVGLFMSSGKIFWINQRKVNGSSGGAPKPASKPLVRIKSQVSEQLIKANTARARQQQQQQQQQQLVPEILKLCPNTKGEGQGPVISSSSSNDNKERDTTSTSTTSPSSSVADRHPVLLQYIKRDDTDETASAAAALLTLAAGRAPSGSASSAAHAGSTAVAAPRPTVIFVQRPGGASVCQEAKGTSTVSYVDRQPVDATRVLVVERQGATQRSVGADGNGPGVEEEEDDDTASMTSQSSAEASLVQCASEQDKRFQMDLSCFQLEAHAHAVDLAGNPVHRCTLCGKVFTVFAAFKAHVTTHVRTKNRCTVCGKIFSRSWLLKGHLRTHTGERPYKCKYAGCERRFADKSNLRSHTLIHTTKDKAYVCTKCKRAFAQKRYLHKHQLEVCKV